MTDRAQDSDESALPGVIAISRAEYTRLRELVYARTGISLGDNKQVLLQNRLGRRVRELGLSSFDQYCDYLETRDPHGSELDRFINAVTTNKTDFFREPHHFDFLRTRWIPAMLERAKRTGERKLRIWSAACSSGEEPYTIAMTLHEAMGTHLNAWDVQILATDLNSDVLQRAANAVYSWERVESLPREVLHRHFLRGTGAHEGKVRVRSEVRRLVNFRRLNFMDSDWGVKTPMNVIFCRNAMIYFDHPTQAQLVTRFLEHIVPEGYLIVGHSESIHGRHGELAQEGNTIYRKLAGGALPAPPTQPLKRTNA